MSTIEKEYRYRINDVNLLKIIQNSIQDEDYKRYLDIVMGKYGFDSLEKLGYIVRVRQKANNIMLECKKRLTNNEWEEANIHLNSVKEAYDFLKLMELEPYLVIDRQREIRISGCLKLFIDKIELIGTFLEIEINSNEDINEMNRFLEVCDIDKTEQPIYGDIFKYQIESNEKFKEDFLKMLNRII